MHHLGCAPCKGDVFQWVQGPPGSQATPRRDLSTLAPLRALRARTPDTAGARRGVDEGVRSCPRAGCGRSASPVRSGAVAFVTLMLATTTAPFNCFAVMIPLPVSLGLITAASDRGAATAGGTALPLPASD